MNEMMREMRWKKRRLDRSPGKFLIDFSPRQNCGGNEKEVRKMRPKKIFHSECKGKIFDPDRLWFFERQNSFYGFRVEKKKSMNVCTAAAKPHNKDRYLAALMLDDVTSISGSRNYHKNICTSAAAP